MRCLRCNDRLPPPCGDDAGFQSLLHGFYGHLYPLAGEVGLVAAGRGQWKFEG